MTQFFLAYEASSDTKKHNGFRVFTSDASTHEEIGELINEKLDTILNSLGCYKGEYGIIATAFNRI